MKDKRLEYWEKNIEGFSGFYNKISEEELVGNKLFTFFYKKFLFPIEKKYMEKRYDLVLKYINDNSSKNKVAIDIGCGSGVFTSILAKSNNKVIATDFAKASLSLTEKLLKNNSCANYDLIQLDLTREEIPKADFAIAIGIAPYIEDMEIFLSNILPNTEKLYFNILDKKNLLNRIRANITFLDVRNYYYHSVEQIKEIAKSHNFSIVRCDNLASGYMIELTLNKEK